MRTTICAVFAVGGCLAAPAIGGVIGTSGNVDHYVAPPASVQEGMCEDDVFVCLFDEAKGFQLEEELYLDISVPGRYEVASELTPEYVEAGTRVNSYFLHQDQVGFNQGRVMDSLFAVTFNEDILGVIVLADRTVAPSGTSLDDSDFLGESVGVLYPKNGDLVCRGTLDTPELDVVILDDTRRTIFVKWRSSDAFIEQLRVITAPLDVSETICPENPDDFQKWYGGPVTGNALDLCADDQVRMTVRQSAQVTPLLPFIRLEYWAYTTLSADTISRLDYLINGHVSAMVPGGQNLDTLRTSIRNFDAGVFEVKDERATAFNADVNINILVTNEAWKYVNTSDGEICVRQDVFSPGDAVSPLWYLKVDLYQVTITQ